MSSTIDLGSLVGKNGTPISVIHTSDNLSDMKGAKLHIEEVHEIFAPLDHECFNNGIKKQMT